MQIKNIVLYKDNSHQPRVLPFKIGKVNIITGDSSTGKTAIIDIIDYCLGSKSFHVKGEKIRDVVSWFAITIQFENEQVFVARQNPLVVDQQSVSDIYFDYGSEVNIPSFDELSNNSNITALNKFISNKLNFHDNLHTSENNTRDALEANFKHSRLFSFQPQTTIAQHKYLFFTQDEPFMPQAIKDTLPYILGAIKENELMILQKIANKRKELNKFLRQQKIEESIQSQSIHQLKMLINEAKELELIPHDIQSHTDDEAIAVLQQISNMDAITIHTSIAENENLNVLLREQETLRKNLSEIKNEIQAVKDFSNDSDDYLGEVKTQHDRLLSIGLYQEPTDKAYWNSLLGKETAMLVPSIEAINKSLSELKQNLEVVELEKPKVQKILTELFEKQSNISDRMNEIRIEINNIYKQNQEIEKLKNTNVKKGRVIGRISLFLESLENLKKDSVLNTSIDKLIKEIDDLESTISKEEKADKLNAILNKINITMSSWSDRLEWEYKNYNLRFDLQKLTVHADSDKKSESLQQMGSGANWLACHLFIHLALHKHFIDTKRPVANFIIFDQPTQIHYPNGYIQEDGTMVKSDDERADERMFDFFFEIANQLAPNLQIIVTDHANFKKDNFQNAIIEEWRGGQKLVPVEWIK